VKTALDQDLTPWGRLRLFRRPCSPNRRTSANHAAACSTARSFQGPLCSRTAGTCGGPECNHNRKRERFAALVTAMTPKRYARRLGSHNPTLCDKSTARFFNIFNLQGIGDVLLTGDLLIQKLRHQTHHRELMRCKCLFWGQSGHWPPILRGLSPGN